MKIKRGDVWRSSGYLPRQVLELAHDYSWSRWHVVYATGGGPARRCLLETFRRWIRARGARRMQRNRRRDMVLR